MRTSITRLIYYKSRRSSKIIIKDRVRWVISTHLSLQKIISHPAPVAAKFNILQRNGTFISEGDDTQAVSHFTSRSKRGAVVLLSFKFERQLIIE